MSHKFPELPERDSLRIGLCSFKLPTGVKITIEIKHLLPVHDLIIFFGEYDGQTVHGYCDFERGFGGLTFDQ